MRNAQKIEKSNCIIFIRNVYIFDKSKIIYLSYEQKFSNKTCDNCFFYLESIHAKYIWAASNELYLIYSLGTFCASSATKKISFTVTLETFNESIRETKPKPNVCLAFVMVHILPRCSLL